MGRYDSDHADSDDHPSYMINLMACLLLFVAAGSALHSCGDGVFKTPTEETALVVKDIEFAEIVFQDRKCTIRNGTMACAERASMAF